MIIPVYNVSAFLEECLNSVMAQTYSNIEIICINDGSTDNSGEILQRYSEQLQNIKVIDKENEGLSAARNTGMEYATGDYIFFLDSDDFFHDNTVLERMVELGNKENLDIVFGNFLYYYDNNAKNKPFRTNTKLTNDIYDGREYLKEGAKTNSLSSVVWNRLYKKDFIENEPFIHGVYYEDMEYTIRVLLKAKRVKMLDLITVNYRQRENSIMSGKLDYKRVLDKVLIAKQLLEIDKRNKAANTWASILIFQAMRNSKQLESNKKSEIISIINSIENLYKIFLRSYSIKHKLFGLLIKYMGIKGFI
ncbi:MAG TPA: glycosyltransferase [Bacillus sp. (in: firmicutes)]|nr:glycosyltransferase [Bacillus sp. (in: firmicutes)]